MKKVILKPSKEKSLLRKHPWIFSGAIKKIEDGIKDGDIVEVFTNKENYIATGHYNEGNISVRIFDFNQTKIDEKYWKLKIEKAYNQRLKTVKIDSENNVFRLIHAEGDHLPGFICDIYNKVAVFQFHSIGMWKHREIFTKIILELLPLDTIYDKSEKT
jgi:23S rRNA (cytosine1962-C5)-methyltransferase